MRLTYKILFVYNLFIYLSQFKCNVRKPGKIDTFAVIDRLHTNI